MADNFKSGFVTLIGRPNVGKSTLMNALIGQKIAITSEKPQTTRNKIQTVYTDEKGQIIFLDTPGIHKAKNKLGEYMVKVAKSTLEDTDVIVWLVEPTTYIGAGEQSIIEVLKTVKQPVILVINKIDTIKDDKPDVENPRSKRAKIEDCINKYKECFDFAEIITIAALRKNGTDKVKDAIMKYLPFGPMYYDEDTVTNQPERQIAAEVIREKCLRLLGDEVPHGIAVTIEKMHERTRGQGDTCMDIEATIVCERDAHKGIIIGKQGAMLKKIGTQSRIEIERLFEYKVNLKLWVKVRKDWRESEDLMKNFGYDVTRIKNED